MLYNVNMTESTIEHEPINQLISFRVSLSTAIALERLAKRERRSVANLLRVLVENAIETAHATPATQPTPRDVTQEAKMAQKN